MYILYNIISTLKGLVDMTIDCNFHLVLTTRRREKTLTLGIRKAVYTGFNTAAIALEIADNVKLISINFDNRTGKNDHVHVLFKVLNFKNVDLHALVLGTKLHSKHAMKATQKEFDWSSTYYLKTVGSVGYEATIYYIEHQADRAE